MWESAAVLSELAGLVVTQVATVDRSVEKRIGVGCPSG
jgi:hypothetical protein